MGRLLCFLGFHKWQRIKQYSDCCAAVFEDHCTRCYITRKYYICSEDHSKHQGVYTK